MQKREPMNVHPVSRDAAREVLMQTTKFPSLRGVGYSALVLAAADRAQQDPTFRAELAAAQRRVSALDREDRKSARGVTV